MDITAIICTYNRSQSLKRTLDSVCELSIPSELEWELIVVDNNSTDNTKEVVNAFQKSCNFCVRYVFEEKQGLSHARNRAIEEAKGELIIWTDDDVLVDERWLVEYVAGFQRHTDAAFFGGPIEPWFETEPPQWLARGMDVYGSALACKGGNADEARIESKADLPYGANMAVRKSAYEDLRYDPNLGRTASDMVSDEETAFFAALLGRGQHGVWLPSVRVRHVITKERMTKRYFRGYYRGYGATLVRLSDYDPSLLVRVAGMPRWLVWRVIVQYALCLRGELTRAQGQEVRWRNLHVDIGRLLEYRRLRESDFRAG